MRHIRYPPHVASISSNWPSVYAYQTPTYRTIRWPGQSAGQTLPAYADDRVGWASVPSAVRTTTQPNAIYAKVVTRPWKELSHPSRPYIQFDQLMGVAPFGHNLHALA